MVQKSCKEQSCVDPWGSLHRDGDVETLEDALKPEFDTFYRNQTKVQYDRCERGFILDAEGPQEFDVFEHGRSQKRLNGRIHWSELV